MRPAEGLGHDRNRSSRRFHELTRIPLFLGMYGASSTGQYFIFHKKIEHNKVRLLTMTILLQHDVSNEPISVQRSV